MNPSTLTDRDAIYLGALLHDVGKFWQRTSTGIPKDKHQILSTSFVNKLLEDERVNAIVAHHHKEDLLKSGLTGKRKVMAEIVCESDNLSSGERVRDDKVQNQEPLKSIFCAITLNNKLNTEHNYQPISSLTPERYEFPTANQTKDLSGKYEQHWQFFTNDCESIDTNDVLLHLYRKYLWCIPSSSYKTVPDVSLYEHSRLAAAIAVCMHDYFTEKRGVNPLLWERIEGRNEERYQLICGDLTGIQSFIYGIGHKGALKALKGRSFFLQHLTTVFTDILLKKMDLPQANLIYVSGGKFYILAPNTTFAEECLDKCSLDFEQKLLQEYNGEIGIVFGSVPLKGSDFIQDKLTKRCPITEKWAELSDIVNENKKRKFSRVLSPEFFAPFGPSGNVEQCWATGKDICEKNDIEEFKYKQELYPVYDDANNEHYISCEQHISQEIGRNLKDAKHLTVGNIDGFTALGLQNFDFLQQKRNENKVFLFNDDDFIGKADDWKFYGGNWSFDGDFDSLAKKSSGIRRLGLLRMDVDNLGTIFKDGLGNNATFSRVVQLSTMLDFFFSSYLNILQTKKWSVESGVNSTNGVVLKDMMQIVYAGGDDLFIVGAWNVLPDVALWIRNEFARFTCNNPSFTISCGIALFPSKFPLAKAAIKAGTAEHKAKGIRIDKHDKIQMKNAVCFFNTPISWGDFEIIRKYVAEIVQLQTQGMSRGLINRLHRIYAEFNDGAGNRWAKWRWRACYSLTRFGEQNKDFKEKIQQFSADLMVSAADKNTEQDLISLLGVIATWADFLTRKENE